MGEVFLARDELLDRKVALKFLPERLEHTTPMPRALPARGQGRRPARPSVHLQGLRDGRGGRPRLHRHGVRRGHDARGAARAAGPCRSRRRLPDRPRDRRGSRGRPRARHRPPRPQAGQRHADRQGHAKVMDFGLAKFVPAEARTVTEDEHPSGQKLTQPGVAVGHPGLHVARAGAGQAGRRPERHLLVRVLLHEMLTGEHPFRRTSALETVSAILRDDPPAIRPGRAGPRPRSRPILRRALAKKPEDRYESARQLADDLRRLRQSLARGEGRRRWRLVAATAVAVAALVAPLVAGAATRKGAAPRPRPRAEVGARRGLRERDGRAGLRRRAGAGLSIGLEGASFINAYSRARRASVASEIDPGSHALGSRDRAPRRPARGDRRRGFRRH